jgi:hypothetical protein
MGWIWDETLQFFADFENLFLSGRLKPKRRKRAHTLPNTNPQPKSQPKPHTNLFDAALPDWMQPMPSQQPRKALPVDVVAALMTLGLASPPAKDELKRLIRRALADAHPDRSQDSNPSDPARRLQDIQAARAILRQHGFA